ncbi:hypothetical protein GIB67_016087 [Kingdonia uniflora]|uniref:Uncharacterized protein n=1 Tax=Kingdonia uniflora TaxID=39325 RepID=A0A7J7L1X4_9MAGN|nr:hypothetical protein GIB67_016087 [Kingdonia uniflora]
MAKSQRSKREKRLRTLRREITIPYYEKKDDAKLAAQDLALAAPKLPVRPYNMDTKAIDNTNMDVEMIEDGKKPGSFLKPVGGIAKKGKKGFKVGRGKHKGKGKIRKKHI